MVCVVPGDQYGSDKQFCFCVVIVQCRINAVMLALTFIPVPLMKMLGRLLNQRLFKFSN